MPPTIKLLTWNDAKAEISKANQALYELIESINPSKHLNFIAIDYPYGNSIVKHGQFVFPPCDSSSIKLIKKELNYSKVPIGLILNKCVEVYYESTERVISDKLWKKGNMLGIWELLDQRIHKNSSQLANVSSGARSVFLLPKIADLISHNRIRKELGILHQPPTSLTQHQPLFAEIAQSAYTFKPWQCRILYFTGEWFKDAESPLVKYFFQEAWKQSYNCRRQFENNVLWEDLLRSIKEHGTYLQPRQISHLKQLYLIAEGIFPGMTFVSKNDKDILPLTLLQEVYEKIYRIKNHKPLFMRPAHITKKHPVYYSLNYPNYFDSFLPSQSQIRLMDDILAIQEAAKILKHDAALTAHPSFNFYHRKSTNTALILPAAKIATQDLHLSKCGITDEKDFPDSSPFFNGVIKISIDKAPT